MRYGSKGPEITFRSDKLLSSLKLLATLGTDSEARGAT